MEKSTHADFPSSLGQIRPELFHSESLRGIYNQQLEIIEFEKEFETSVNSLWTTFVSDLEGTLDRNEPFNLTDWVQKYVDECLGAMKDGMIEGFENLSVKMLALCYILSNLAEISPGIYAAIPTDGHLIKSDSEGNLEDALNFSASMSEYLTDAYNIKLQEVTDTLIIEKLKRKLEDFKNHNNNSN